MAEQIYERRPVHLITPGLDISRSNRETGLAADLDNASSRIHGEIRASSCRRGGISADLHPVREIPSKLC